ncbi:Na/Pi cotransporter family protein [Antarctobacter sp.]|uniref:Na/Pi cotransporter family protein n=1 Tax=Antarctobacter sp. TaxID=1872577 RepID=UPI003A91C8D8
MKTDLGANPLILLSVNLAAAVALLLWSVRLIRTGVERAFMPELRRHLKSLSHRPVSAAAGGSVAAMLLQSSTAVALIGGGFVASGMLAPPSALALLLGADLGSAAMARVLMSPVEVVIPFLLLIGILTFFNARSRKAKQVGRIVIGFALVLVSLQMIRTATTPIGENEIVQATAAYFANDLLSAFLIGAVLAWIMHSSLAAILTFATFAASGLIAVPVAAALVIGANLGGAVVPLVLLSAAPRPVRQVVVGNLLARGGMTLAALCLVVFDVLDLSRLGPDAGQQVVMLHILLNAALVVIGLSGLRLLIRFSGALVPVAKVDADPTVSALDPKALENTDYALACGQRELLRMAETVQAMLIPVMGLFREWNPQVAQLIEKREDAVDRMHFETKIYLSKLRDKSGSGAQPQSSVELVALANHLEEAADKIAVNLLALAKKMNDEAVSFSEQGLADIEQFHDQVVTNTQLALNVLTTGDAEAARQLVAEKDRVRIEEQRLQARHLNRLRKQPAASVETTNIHQETLRLFKQINAALCYVAYPIAEKTGDLLGSRLAQPRYAAGST